ncbi:MAG TPA: NADPH-dependent FMN reductase [Candidatus Binataceae bacterium]|nr:NADPH-dependent FMN reductase [Candidatus Binataceae bacterium]
MVKLVAILGSVTPPGRSLRAMEWAVRCAAEEATGAEAQLLNLANYKIAFADGRPPEQLGDDTAAVVRAITDADSVLLASPVYRGSFTGALKNLLDHLPLESLAGKPCGVVAIGATHHHYLGVDWHLREVLAWFGALLAPTSVYLSADDFVNGEPTASACAQLRELVRTLLKLSEALSAARLEFGPRPLAARRG